MEGQCLKWDSHLMSLFSYIYIYSLLTYAVREKLKVNAKCRSRKKKMQHVQHMEIH